VGLQCLLPFREGALNRSRVGRIVSVVWCHCPSSWGRWNRVDPAVAEKDRFLDKHGFMSWLNCSKTSAGGEDKAEAGEHGDEARF
jgi:hypothetical protein